jgi:hypothetical protein
MRKVLFTESQMRQILDKVGLNEWSEVSSGYLNQNSNGSEPPANVSGVEISANVINPEDEEQENVTTTDAIADTECPQGMHYGYGRPFPTSQRPIAEDIEQQTFIANKYQRNDAKNSGTKMGLNIATKTKRTTSNGTQRKRKHDLELHKKEMSPEEYKKKYGDIEKIVKSSLKQMSNVNDALTNVSDTNKLTNANDATKVKTSTKKGHHEGEELSNGRLHYFK